MALSAIGTVGTINTNTATAASFTWAPGAVGNAMFLWVWLPSTSNTITSISSTNATWTLVDSFNGTTNANKVYLYQGVASSTSSATVSLVLAGSPGTNTIRSGRQEFHSSVGAIPVATVTSTLDSAGTNTWPTVAATGLYAGWAFDSGTGVNGSTSGFTYQLDANSNSLAYDLSATSSSAPVFGDSTQAIGIMTIIVEGVFVVKGTPDQVSASAGVASSTTSISPSAGSLVRWSVAWLNSNDTLGITFTAADSHGTSYGAPTLVPTSGPGDGDGGCYLMIWDHLYSSAPGATTLTVTASGSGVSGAAPSAAIILPYTVTGQSSTPEGAFNSFNEVGTGTTTYQIAITPQSVGSAVSVLAAPNYDGGAVGAVTAISGTVTDDDWQNATVGSRGTLGSGATPVTATTSTTYGWTSANASPFGYGVMAAEILPAGSTSTVTSTGAVTLNMGIAGTVGGNSLVTSTGGVTLKYVVAGTGAETFASTGGVALNMGIAGEVGVPFVANGALGLKVGVSGTAFSGVTGTGGVALNEGISGTSTVANPVTSTGAVTLGLAVSGTSSSNITATGALTLSFGIGGTAQEVLPSTQFGVVHQWDGSNWVPYQLGTSSAGTSGVFDNALASLQMNGPSVIAGVVDAASITANSIGSASITGSVFNGGTVTAENIVVTEGANGTILVYGHLTTPTVTTFTSGSGNWTCPAGVTTARVQAWGGGGGGGGGANTSTGGGDGGGGGEYAEEPALAVTPGHSYAYVVGAGGAAGNTTPTNGGNGSETLFEGDAVNVIANPGFGGPDGLGGGYVPGGAGSTNTIHFNGGSGGEAPGVTFGGGGGAAAGTSNSGAAGNPASSFIQGSGGLGINGGGDGGQGSDSSGDAGNGVAPGGGGGGGFGFMTGPS